MKRIFLSIVLIFFMVSCNNKDSISKTKIVNDLILKTEVALKNNNWKKAETYLDFASSLKETKEMITLRNKIEMKKRDETLLEKGKKAYKNKDWNKSLEYFNQLLKDNSNNKIVLKYKRKVDFEIHNNKLINKAKKYILENDYKSSLLELYLIKESSIYYSEAKELMILIKRREEPSNKLLIDKSRNDLLLKNFKSAVFGLNSINKNSKYYNEAKNILDSINIEYTKHLFFLAQKANKNKEYSKAITLLNDIPIKQLFNKNSKELREEINKNIVNFKTEFQLKYKKEYLLYSKEKFNEVIEKLQKKKSSEDIISYISKIKDVQKYKILGDQAFKNKKRIAIKYYLKVLEFDKTLGAFYNLIRLRILKLFIKQSHDLLLKRNYEDAFKSLILAQKYGNSDELDTILDIFRKKAKNIYLRSYQRMSTNPDSAKTGFLRIIKMLPSNELIYKKAKDKLRRYYDFVDDNKDNYKDFNDNYKDFNDDSENKSNDEIKIKDGVYGYLSLMSIPNTSVKIDNIKTGKTPLVKFKLTVGKHKVELSNKKRNILDTFFIHIKKDTIKPLIKRY